MAGKSLLTTLPWLVLSGSLALADDWFDAEGAGVDPADTEDSSYSDPWVTEDDNDPERHNHADGTSDNEPDRLQIYDEQGRQTGRADRNPFLDDGYTLYDDRGRRTGRAEKNAFLEDRYNVYDERGRRVREVRKNSFLDNQYDIYDERGRRLGKIRKNSFIEGQYDIYDERGRRIGRIEGD